MVLFQQGAVLPLYVRVLQQKLVLFAVAYVCVPCLARAFFLDVKTQRQACLQQVVVMIKVVRYAQMALL